MTVANKPPIIAKKKPKPQKGPEDMPGYKAGILWGSWKANTPTQEFLSALANSLMEFFDANVDMFNLEEFFWVKRLDRRTFYKWTEKSEDLFYATEMVKMAIGMRREKGAILRKYDSHSAFLMMSLYNESFKDVSEWRAKLRRPEDSSDTKYVLRIENIPSSDMVPVKRSE